jgi:hypothetical protein
MDEIKYLALSPREWELAPCKEGGADLIWTLIDKVSLSIF